MLPRERCGTPRYVPTIALLTPVLFWGAGCSRPPTLIAPHRYVRLDALLPLHPSWAQIQALDREVARLKTAPAQAGSFDYEPYPALPVFVPRVSTSANAGAERAAQVDREAKRYIDSLSKSLDAVNQSLLGVERRREQRRVDAAVAARIADLKKQLQAENDLKLFAIQQELRKLTFRDIVVNSRIQDLAQAHTRDMRPLREAQAEHETILADIGKLNTANSAIVDQDVVKEAGRKRDAYYREEQAKSRQRLAKRAGELNADRQEKVAAALKQQRVTPIPPLASRELPPVDPHSTPLPLPAEAAISVQPAAARLMPALNKQAMLWETQRSNLVSEIRADTSKAVQQVALRRGWKLVPGPELGAEDGTSEAAEAVRGQWQAGKTP